MTARARVDAYLRRNGSATSLELAAMLDIPQDTVRSALRRLRVRRVGRQGRAPVWSLP